MEEKRYVITMLVENEPGVTARVTGLFAGRGYNIETICGAPTANPNMSRITITTRAVPHQLAQCMKQIERLTNVIKLRDMTTEEAIQRELALICVNVLPEQRADLLRLVEPFHARILDIGSAALTLEITDSTETIDKLLALLEKNHDIRKLSRSGTLALYRES